MTEKEACLLTQCYSVACNKEVQDREYSTTKCTVASFFVRQKRSVYFELTANPSRYITQAWSSVWFAFEISLIRIFRQTKSANQINISNMLKEDIVPRGK